MLADLFCWLNGACTGETYIIYQTIWYSLLLAVGTTCRKQQIRKARWSIGHSFADKLVADLLMMNLRMQWTCLSIWVQAGYRKAESGYMMAFLVQKLCSRKARPRHYDMVMALPLWTMFQNQFTQSASQATKNRNNVMSEPKKLHRVNTGGHACRVLTTPDPLSQVVSIPSVPRSCHVASLLAGVKDVSGLGAGDSALIPEFLEAGTLHNNGPYFLRLDSFQCDSEDTPCIILHLRRFSSEDENSSDLSVAVKHRRLPEASEADRFFEKLLPGGEIEYQQWYHMPVSCQKKFNGADPWTSSKPNKRYAMNLMFIHKYAIFALETSVMFCSVAPWSRVCK